MSSSFALNDFCTWENAPDWWNPCGEKIREIGDGWVLLDYWRSTIPINQLRLITPADPIVIAMPQVSVMVPEVAA